MTQSSEMSKLITALVDEYFTNYFEPLMAMSKNKTKTVSFNPKHTAETNTEEESSNPTLESADIVQNNATFEEVLAAFRQEFLSPREEGYIFALHPSMREGTMLVLDEDCLVAMDDTTKKEYVPTLLMYDTETNATYPFPDIMNHSVYSWFDNKWTIAYQLL